MNSDPENYSKWRPMVSYLKHRFVFFVTRFVLLIAILAAVLITPLMVFALSVALILVSIYIFGWDSGNLSKLFNLKSLNWVSLAFKNSDNIAIVTLLLILLLSSNKRLRNSLSNILVNAGGVFQKPVQIEVDNEKSPYGIWRYYFKKIWPSLKSTYAEFFALLTLAAYPNLRRFFTNVWKYIVEPITKYKELIVAVASISVITSVTFNVVIQEHRGPGPTEAWSDSVTAMFGALKDTVNGIAIPGTKEWRDSVTNSLKNIEENVVRATPSISYLFKEDDEFLLVYREGDLKTKDGICPDDRNSKWLELFKSMIVDTHTNTDPTCLELKISGFASISPVLVGGVIDSLRSDALNCEIANQRAEALVYFLTTEPYDSTECRTVLNDDRRWGRTDGEIIKRGRPDTSAWNKTDFVLTYDQSLGVRLDGPHFDVTYNPWKKYEDMAKEKPAKDDSSGVALQHDLQFVNRSAHITIGRGAN